MLDIRVRRIVDGFLVNTTVPGSGPYTSDERFVSTDGELPNVVGGIVARWLQEDEAWRLAMTHYSRADECDCG